MNCYSMKMSNPALKRDAASAAPLSFTLGIITQLGFP